MDYMTKVEAWKNSKNVPQYLKDELALMNEEELENAFYCDMEFGTAGMRGVMGPGTNRLNEVVVTKATVGFGKYLLRDVKDAATRGVVIAYDNRLHNKDFAMAAARTLSSLGIKVFVFDSLRTTPELSFAVRYLKCAGGIVITASHNPKQYNGYKIYNEEGNQCILAQSNIVLEEINKITDELSIEVTPNYDLIETLNDEVDEAYYDMILKTALRPEMDKSNITIVYTPQHGTGYVAVTTTLKRLGYKVIEVAEQCFPSFGFENTKTPNPEQPAAYDLAVEYAQKYNADIVCTTDPDCDRVGIVLFDKNRKPVYMTGNQTGAILIDYLFTTRKEKGLLSDNGVIYNTIVTSPLGEKVAASYGVACEKTLTGFKYIGDKIARSIENNGKHFEMGYEESYGYLLNPAVRDKDGVQSIMMICEMASYTKHQGKTLLEKYEEVQQKFSYFVDDQYSYEAPGITGKEKIASIMNKFRTSNLTEICGEKVVIFEDYKSLKRNDRGVVTDLDYEVSNVLRYIFEDGSFVAVRPSGTEPKCKFYFSIAGKTHEAAQVRHDTIKQFVLDFIK